MVVAVAVKMVKEDMAAEVGEKLAAQAKVIALLRLPRLMAFFKHMI